MNELEFQNILKEKGIEVSEHQLQQFQKYYEILVEWNEKMNLTAITDKEDVYLKHFYDSITIAFDFDFNNQTLIDVGAGAGFPSPFPQNLLYGRRFQRRLFFAFLQKGAELRVVHPLIKGRRSAVVYVRGPVEELPIWERLMPRAASPIKARW